MDVKSKHGHIKSNPEESLLFRNSVSKNIAQLSSINYADRNVQAALEQLSERKFKNEREARKQLPFEVFSDLIWTNGSIIKELSELSSQTLSVQSQLLKVKNSIDSYKNEWSKKTNDTQILLNSYETFCEEEALIEEKLKNIEIFEKNFVIMDDDLIHLTSSTDVDDRFYLILDKAQEIHDSSDSLFASLSGFVEYSSFEEIVKKMSRYIEAAFEKLFRCVQTELSDPQTAQTLEANSHLKKAFTKLFSEPTMVNKSINLIVQARQQILSTAYLTALTRGDFLSSSRPIELSAPDTVRFIGDLLAWIHQTIVNEKELVEALFAARKRQIQLNPFPPWDVPNVLEDQMNSLLDGSLYGICRPLSSRAQTSVLDLSDIVRLYNVIEILGFYREAFSKIVHDECIILRIIKTLEDFTYQRMKTVLDDELYTISNTNLSITDDLLPPDFVTTFLRNANSIFKIRGASLSVQGVDELPFKMLFMQLFDRILEICAAMTEDVRPPYKGIILMLNVLDSCTNYVGRYTFLNELFEYLQEKTTYYKNNLTTLLNDDYIAQAGLSDLLQKIADTTDDKQALKNYLHSWKWDQQIDKFSTFIRKTLSETIDNLQLLTSPIVTNQVLKETAISFVGAIETVDKALELSNLERRWPLSTEELLIAMNVDSMDTLSDIGQSDIDNLSVN
ncbi:hypothetical protein POMI540_1577 [Schizosaccharomyces pombe]